jgi:hypothetical protein
VVDDDLHEKMLRAARNQSLYREINERLEDFNEVFSRIADLDPEWLCECADENCVEPMRMSLGEYETLRSQSNRFAVLPGHVYAEVERVVTENERYVVVEKLGAATKFIEDNDPRRSRR